MFAILTIGALGFLIFASCSSAWVWLAITNIKRDPSPQRQRIQDVVENFMFIGIFVLMISGILFAAKLGLLGKMRDMFVVKVK
jgi:hypothetical protein